MSRIKKRGKRWYADFTIDGERHRPSLGDLPKAEAEKMARDLEHALVSRRLGLKSKKSPLLKDFYVAYSEYSKANHAPKTVRDISYTFGKNLIPFFGDKRLSEIDTALIEQFKSIRRGLVSDSTINKDLRYLRAMLGYAKSLKKVDGSNMPEVKLLSTTTKAGRILDELEIEQIESSSHYLRPLFITAIHTGLRANELFNLTWGDVDFEEKTIAVMAKGDWHPKNYKNRIVPMTERLYDILLELRAMSSELVFIGKNGAKVKDVRSAIKNICRETGVSKFTLHDLRRTFASYMGFAGCDIQSIQEVMGHSDVRTTMGYMRTGLKRIRKSVDKLPFAPSRKNMD